MLNSYNLFRRKQDRDLFCAVGQDRPVPPFVKSDEWEFGGTVVDNGEATPDGFRTAEASEAMLLNGYYLFLATRAQLDAQAPTVQNSAAARDAAPRPVRREAAA